MSNIEAENNESYLDDDEYEEVVVEEPNEGEKKRSVWRILRRILYVLCILTAIAAAIVYVVAKNAIRDGGYCERRDSFYPRRRVDWRRSLGTGSLC